MFSFLEKVKSIKETLMLKKSASTPKSEMPVEREIEFDVEDFFRGYLLIDIAVGVLLSPDSKMFNDEQKKCLQTFWENAPTKRVPPVEDVLAYFRQKELNEMSKKLDM